MHSVGKPEQPLIDILSEKLSVDPEKTYMFGDNVDVRALYPTQYVY